MICISARLGKLLGLSEQYWGYGQYGPVSPSRLRKNVPEPCHSERSQPFGCPSLAETRRAAR